MNFTKRVLKEKRLLAIARDVATRYAGRNELMFRRISEYITAVRGGFPRRSILLVVFPSCRLLEEVDPLISLRDVMAETGGLK